MILESYKRDFLINKTFMFQGVLSGLVVGIVTSAWLGVGNFIYGVSPQFSRKVSNPDTCTLEEQAFNSFISYTNQSSDRIFTTVTEPTNSDFE